MGLNFSILRSSGPLIRTGRGGQKLGDKEGARRGRGRGDATETLTCRGLGQLDLSYDPAGFTGVWKGGGKGRNSLWDWKSSGTVHGIGDLTRGAPCVAGLVLQEKGGELGPSQASLPACSLSYRSRFGNSIRTGRELPPGAEIRAREQRLLMRLGFW